MTSSGNGKRKRGVVDSDASDTSSNSEPSHSYQRKRAKIEDTPRPKFISPRQQQLLSLDVHRNHFQHEVNLMSQVISSIEKTHQEAMTALLETSIKFMQEQFNVCQATRIPNKACFIGYPLDDSEWAHLPFYRVLSVMTQHLTLTRNQGRKYDWELIRIPKCIHNMKQPPYFPTEEEDCVWEFMNGAAWRIRRRACNCACLVTKRVVEQELLKWLRRQDTLGRTESLLDSKCYIAWEFSDEDIQDMLYSATVQCDDVRACRNSYDEEVGTGKGQSRPVEPLSHDKLPMKL